MSEMVRLQNGSYRTSLHKIGTFGNGPATAISRDRELFPLRAVKPVIDAAVEPTLKRTSNSPEFRRPRALCPVRVTEEQRFLEVTEHEVRGASKPRPLPSRTR